MNKKNLIFYMSIPLGAVVIAGVAHTFFRPILNGLYEFQSQWTWPAIAALLMLAYSITRFFILLPARAKEGRLKPYHEEMEERDQSSPLLNTPKKVGLAGAVTFCMVLILKASNPVAIPIDLVVLSALVPLLGFGMHIYAKRNIS